MPIDTTLNAAASARWNEFHAWRPAARHAFRFATLAIDDLVGIDNPIESGRHCRRRSNHSK